MHKGDRKKHNSKGRIPNIDFKSQDHTTTPNLKLILLERRNIDM